MDFKDITEITVYGKESGDLIARLFKDENGIKQIVSDDVEIFLIKKSPSEGELIK